MKTIPLYKYERAGGGTTVSPRKPDREYTEMHRLVADKGKMLQNGETIISCIDAENTDNWIEIDNPDTKEGGTE